MSDIHFTPKGIHIPTAETFYLVLLTFSSLEREEVEKIMEVVSLGEPIY